MHQFILSGFGDEIAPSLLEQMDCMEKLGIRYIETRGVNGTNVSSLTERQAKEAKRELDARGFRVSAIGSPIGKVKLTDSFDEHLEAFRRTLQTAHIFETKYLRMFSFFMEDGVDPADCKNEVIERLSRLVEEAKATGIVLLHENEKEIYGDTAARCHDLFAAIDSPYFRATFDPANFVQCGEDTLKAYELLEEKIEYFHIKDALFSDASVVPAGQGDGNVRELLSRLIQKGYRGFLSLEPHLGSFEGLAAFEKHLDTVKVEKGGAQTFAVAYFALKDLLEQLGSPLPQATATTTTL